MAIAQFPGETRKEAIDNHFGLELGEDEDFFYFIETMGYTVDADDETIEGLYGLFKYNDSKDI